MPKPPFETLTFWTHSTEETMRESFNTLVLLGMTRENAEDFLLNLYYAVSEEYGA